MGDGVDEVESMIEKMSDLHDKLSDTIHSISRAHFLNSLKNPWKPDEFPLPRRKKSPDDLNQKMSPGFVFVKDFVVDEEDLQIQEAKSLYAIRTALENLEDQLEFFQTVQMQQLTERDSALVRLEQSHIILSMRLAEYEGKKYKVIEESNALIGDVQNASLFLSPEEFYGYGSNFAQQKGKQSNPVVNFLFSTFTWFSKSLKLDHTVGFLGNAALFTLSVLAIAHISRDEIGSTYDRKLQKFSETRVKASNDHLATLDVFLARG